MISKLEVQRQLRAIGAEFRFWGRAEMKELEHVLVPGETIKFCLNGRYEGGFAMLCITDQRIILIDKKPFYLTLEDIRYDMVSEVDFNQRLVDSTIVVCTVNKTLHFTSFKAKPLRSATSYLQNRVMEFRQQHMMPTQPDTVTAYIQTPVTTSGPIKTKVKAIEHRVINPYTRVPLMMRRRMSRFYS